MTSEFTRAISRRRLLSAALAVPVTAVVAACGKDAAAGASIQMTSEMTFAPASITIKTGETVTWRNDGDMVHTATADASKVRDASLIELPAGALPWDSGNVSRGQTWSYTFTVPGRYRYVCLPHFIVGMTGEVIVEP